MIRKLTKQMLMAQTLSALTVSLCLLIDNIMIGRFLGVQAIAAYGLANPILLVIGATMIVGEKKLPALFCRTRTGLIPPCSDPFRGFRFAR